MMSGLRKGLSLSLELAKFSSCQGYREETNEQLNVAMPTAGSLGAAEQVWKRVPASESERGMHRHGPTGNCHGGSF